MPAELALGIAAAVAACLALGLLFWVWVKLKRLRAAQSVLLGGGKSDLVDFAVSLQGRIDDLHGAVDELAAALSRGDRRGGGGRVGGDRRRRRPPVGVDRLPRREPDGDGRDGDPGPRLCADLRQGPRPRPLLDRALARGARGRRARDEPL